MPGENRKGFHIAVRQFWCCRSSLQMRCTLIPVKGFKEAFNIKQKAYKAERKKTMKKILAMLLAVVMVLSLCACQADPAETTESTKSTTAPTSGSTEGTAALVNEPVYPIVKEGDDPITIKALVTADVSTSKDRTVWQKVEEVTGINIEYDYIDGEALTTYLAGNEWPDIFITNISKSLINDYGVLGGRFVNYLDYLEYMPNLQKTFEDYPSSKAIYSETNGEMYELFAISEATTIIYPRPLYRTDLAKKAGYEEAPKTVEELKDMLIKVKEITGKYPFTPMYDEEMVKWPAVIYNAFGPGHTLGLDVDNATGKVFLSRTTEQYKHYLEYMHELYELGLIDPEAATYAADVRTELELGGGIVLIQQAEAKLTEEFFESGNVDLWCMAPLTSEYDNTQTFINRSPVLQDKSDIVINAESEYIVEICQMLDILHATEEVVEGSGLMGQSFTYGLKGIDWDFTETSFVQTPPEGQSANTYLYAEAIWNNQGRADLFGNMVSEGTGNNPTRQSAYLNVVKAYETDYDYVLGFLTFTEDEQYVIDNSMADIQAYYRAKHVEFVTGVSDIEKDWDAYIAEFEKMNLSGLLEVYQAAYDRFMANM